MMCVFNTCRIVVFISFPSEGSILLAYFECTGHGVCDFRE